MAAARPVAASNSRSAKDPDEPSARAVRLSPDGLSIQPLASYAKRKLAPMRILLIPIVSLVLSGCLARTAVDVVTLPVKVVSTGVDAVGAGVDAVTTSQAEADQRRGRQIREEEQRLGRLARRCARQPERDECRDLEATREPNPAR